MKRRYPLPSRPMVPFPQKRFFEDKKTFIFSSEAWDYPMNAEIAISLLEWVGNLRDYPIKEYLIRLQKEMGPFYFIKKLCESLLDKIEKHYLSTNVIGSIEVEITKKGPSGWMPGTYSKKQRIP